MKIKATKTMADFLQKYFKKYTIYKTQLTTNSYQWCVDIDSYKHDNDFDSKTNKFNVIVIEYPLDYYACNKYLTTNDLTKLFNKSDKTINGFIENVKNEIEI